MKPIVTNLRILWRAERMRAEAQLRDATQKISLLAVAALVGVFALGMLNVAAFFALVPSQGSTMAAFWVAAADAVLALALVALALSRRSHPEMELIEEVRDNALANLEEEAAAIQAQIADARQEIAGLASSVKSFSRDPLGALSPTMLLPLLKTVVGFLKDARK
jgi:hypothetical protein